MPVPLRPRGHAAQCSSFCLPFVHRPFHSRGLGTSPTSKTDEARQGWVGPFFRECGYTPYACYVTVSPLTRRSQTSKLPAKKTSGQKKVQKKRALARPHKKENRGCFYSPSVSSFGCLIFKAPSMAPSTIGRYCSGQSFSLWLTRFRSSLSSRMTSGLK